MYDRKHLEKMLSINGIAPNASEEEVRKTLREARYRDEEVDQALAVLRGEAIATSDIAAGAAKLLTTDQTLSPADISRLLGIEVVLPKRATDQAPMPHPANLWKQRLVISLLSLLLAFIGLGLAMYLLKVGIFHPVSAYASFQLW
jgi:hypothetical protein